MRKPLLVLIIAAALIPTTANAIKKQTKKAEAKKEAVETEYTPCDTVVVKQLLTAYVETSLSQRDEKQAMERLNLVFDKQESDKAKNEFRNVIYKELLNYQRNDRSAESLAAINAYLNFADLEDRRLPAIYFTKGDIYAHELNDSLTLKECIADLLVLDKTSNPNVDGYIAKLRGFLQEIRDYVPVCQRMAGAWWVSIDPWASKQGFPYIIMKGEKDGKIAFCGGGIQEAGTIISLEENYLSQNETDFNNNSAYIVWSSEKLDIPSDLGISLRNSFAAGMGNAFGSALSDALGSSFLGGIGGNLMSAFVGSMFQKDPKKTINIVEATLHMVNNYEIEMHIKFQAITITPSGQDIKESERRGLLMKVTPKIANDLNLIFKHRVMGANYPILTNAYFDKDITNNPNEDKEAYKTYLKEHKERWKYVSNLPNSDDAIFAWNQLQRARLFDYCENKIKQEGAPQSRLYHTAADKNTLGIECDVIEKFPKAVKKYPNIKGLYVTAVSKDGTAILYGLKEGDIILSIDGFAPKTPADITIYLSSLERFSPIQLKVLRKGKEKLINIDSLGFIYYHNEKSNTN